MLEVRVCPICNQSYTDYPAISRIDNETEICTSCGVAEAFINYIEYMESNKNEE